MKKLLSLCLCLVMVLACLTACQDKTPDEPDTTVTTAPTEPTPPPAPVITEIDELTVEALANYTVIYSENASGDVESAAKDLVKALNAKFGTEIEHKDDYVSDKANSKDKVLEFEILVGPTNRDESKTFEDTLLYRDYGYGIVGKKLVITGYTDDTIIEAVEAFTEAYIDGAEDNATVLFKKENNTVVKDEYTQGAITINGTDVSSYRIVYPAANENFEAALAEKLAYTLADVCGVLPEIVADTEAYADGYEILIGKTNRSASLAGLDANAAAGTGYAAVEGKFVVLAGNTAWGNATAVVSLTDAIETAAPSDKLEHTITAGTVTESADAALTTMSFYITDTSVKSDRLNRVVATILEALPDTIGLQEVNESWLTKLEERLGAYYDIVGDANTNGLYTAVMYAKEKFTAHTLAEGESYTTLFTAAGATEEQTYTLVTLTRNSDNLTFMHLNAQLDTSSAAVRKQQIITILELLEANEDKAVVFTANMNTNAASSEYLLLVMETLESADWLAEAPVTDGNANRSDFVFVVDEYMDVVSYECVYELVRGGYASPDHAAVVVEYVIDYNGTDEKPTVIEAGDSLLVGRDTEGDEYGDLNLVS